MISIQHTPPRLLSCSLASLGVHGGAAAALFLGLSGANSAPPPAAMIVELAPMPSAPPVEPNLSPPAPEQEEAQPKPVEDKLKIPPLPKLAFAIKPEVAVPLKPLEDEKKQKVSEKPADETTRLATPFAPNKDAPKAPSFGAPSNVPSNAELSWESRVLAALERKKRYPGDAQRQGHEDVVYVRIALDRQGRVLDSQIRKSRGFSMLDLEVKALVRRASPLPAPPKEVAGNPVTLIVPVEFFLSRRRS